MRLLESVLRDKSVEAYAQGGNVEVLIDYHANGTSEHVTVSPRNAVELGNRLVRLGERLAREAAETP